MQGSIVLKRSVVLIALSALMAALTAQAQSASGSESAASAASAPVSPDQLKAMKRADRKLRGVIGTALARTQGLDSTRISIRVRSGNVTLFGSVPDASQIALAAQVAGQVAGVKSVTNALRVDSTNGALLRSSQPE